MNIILTLNDVECWCLMMWYGENKVEFISIYLIKILGIVCKWIPKFNGKLISMKYLFVIPFLMNRNACAFCMCVCDFI